MTQMLMVILHDLNRLPEILDAWKKIGVPGVTILNSVGGFQATELMRRKGLSGFLKLFEEVRSTQRILFSLIDDEELLEQAISEADRIVKGFETPQSGILFTMPIGQVLGLQKWDVKKPAEETGYQEMAPEDQTKSNLLRWLEEDIAAKYGADSRVNWSKKRRHKISQIMRTSEDRPIVVRMDQPLKEVLNSFAENPDDCIACVENREGRLMGIIHSQQLAEMMFIPVIPEEYIDDPEGYDQAVKYADPNNLQVAAEIMNDPVFVYPDDSLEHAFSVMRDNNIPGIPVVDKNYRVKGFVTLVDLLKVCYLS